MELGELCGVWDVGGEDWLRVADIEEVGVRGMRCRFRIVEPGIEIDAANLAVLTS